MKKEPILRKVTEGDQLQKNVRKMSGTVNKGDEIKQPFELLKKKR